MAIDHSSHDHPATPAARAACRKRMSGDDVAAGMATTPQPRTVAHAAKRGAQRAVAGSDAPGGTTDTRPRRSRTSRRSEPIGRWVPVTMADANEGDRVRIAADPSTGRQVWCGDVIAWNSRYLSIDVRPDAGYTRHLRVDKGEVLSVERFESDAPEWQRRNKK